MDREMDRQRLKTIIEAGLLAAGEPLSLERLLGLFPEEEQPDRDALRQALEDIAADCEGRSLELKEVGSGFRLQVRADLAPWVSRLWEERPARYSRALLETLALIAYRQPITRAEIEDIRGVSVSSSIVRTLQEREWVRVVGHRDVPGKPAMYATTRQFLDYFNLKSLDQLPPLAELRDIDSIEGQFGFAERTDPDSADAAESAEPSKADDDAHAEYPALDEALAAGDSDDAAEDEGEIAAAGVSAQAADPERTEDLPEEAVASTPEANTEAESVDAGDTSGETNALHEEGDTSGETNALHEEGDTSGETNALYEEGDISGETDALVREEGDATGETAIPNADEGDMRGESDPSQDDGDTAGETFVSVDEARAEAPDEDDEDDASDLPRAMG